MFFGVPRIYEKFEEAIKGNLDKKGPFAKKLFEWARGVGYQKI